MAWFSTSGSVEEAIQHVVAWTIRAANCAIDVNQEGDDRTECGKR